MTRQVPMSPPRVGIMQRFTQLSVWQHGHNLALAIYEATRCFPREEIFGVVAQLRRASVSVTCNIAEGTRRRHRLDYARFLNLAESSTAEMETLLMLSKDLGYLNMQKATELLSDTDRVARMLSALRRKVELVERRESSRSVRPSTLNPEL